MRKGTYDMHYILMCRSLTVSQRAARALQRAGFFAAVVKAPQSANPDGCTYGVKIAQRNLTAARALLYKSGIPVENVLELHRDGDREVDR